MISAGPGLYLRWLQPSPPGEMDVGTGSEGFKEGSGGGS